MIKKSLLKAGIITFCSTILFSITACGGKKEPERIAVVETTKGTFKFTLYEEKAPITTKNFIELTEKNFYNGLSFHRYVPDFVVQGGDPLGDGTGGSEKTIPLEVNSSLTHEEGAVGMARSAEPNSGSSQFYVTLAPTHNLDGNYAVFGKVTEGMNIVKQLRVGDKMLKVYITVPSQNNSGVQK